MGAISHLGELDFFSVFVGTVMLAIILYSLHVQQRQKKNVWGLKNFIFKPFHLRLNTWSEGLRSCLILPVHPLVTPERVFEDFFLFPYTSKAVVLMLVFSSLKPGLFHRGSERYSVNTIPRAESKTQCLESLDGNFFRSLQVNIW